MEHKVSKILTFTLKNIPQIKIKSLYRNELDIVCICGNEDIISLKDIKKYGVIRCNSCYEKSNDINISDEKIKFIGDIIKNYIQD